MDCSNCICENKLKLACLLTEGLWTGMIVSFNVVGMPTLSKMQDKEAQIEAYLDLYKKGRNCAIGSTVILCGLLGTLYGKTKDLEYLYPCPFLLLKVPITYFILRRLPTEEDKRTEESMEQFLD